MGNWPIRPKNFEHYEGLSQNDFQYPVLEVCKHTKESMRECTEQLNKSAGEAVQQDKKAFIPTPQFKTKEYTEDTKDDDINPYETRQEKLALFESSYGLDQTSAKTGGGTDFGSPLYTTQAGSEAFCVQQALDKMPNPIECFCTEYVFDEEEPKKNGGAGADDDSSTSEQSPSVSASVSNANREAFNTSIDAYGNVIVDVYGEVIVGGTILWIDDVYYVPKIEYKPLSWKVDKEFNVSGDTSVKKTYKRHTNLLLSLGSEGIDNVKAVSIDGKLIPETHYEITDNVVRHVHNGDHNASRYLPAYRDHTVLYIKDIEVTNFSDIKVHVQESISGFSSRDFLSAATTLPAGANRVTFYDDQWQYYLNGEIKNRSSFPVFGESPYVHEFPAIVSSEPSWWQTKGAEIFYHWSGALRRYDTFSEFDTVIANMAPTKIIGYYSNTDRFIYYSDGKIYNHEYESAVPREPDNIVMYDWYADVFDYENNTMTRFTAEHSSALQFAMLSRTIYHGVMVMPHHYLVYADGVIDVYVKREMTLLGTIENVPMVTPVNTVSIYSSANNMQYSFINGPKIVQVDLRTMSIKEYDTPDGIQAPIFQIFQANNILAFSSDGTCYIVNMTFRGAETNAISVGSLLEELGSRWVGRHDRFISGAVNSDTQGLVDNLIELFVLPEEDFLNVIPLSVVNADVEHTEDYDYKEGLVLTYPELDILSKKQAVLNYYTGDSIENYEFTSNVFLSYEQAYIAAANYYIKQKDSTSTMTVETMNLENEVGTIVSFEGQKYKITEHTQDKYSKFTCVAVSDMSIDSAPEEPVTPAVPPVYKWAFEGTKLHWIPIALGGLNTSTYCYIGSKPSKVCINFDCGIDVSASPMLSYGKLVAPYPLYQSTRGVRDDDSVLTVQFTSDPATILTSATYEELIENEFLNLLLVGHEAIQFMDFNIHIDNRTVTFYGGLLRGRHNTSFFENFHLFEEPVFLYNENQLTVFDSPAEEFVLRIDDSNEDIYVKNLSYGTGINSVNMLVMERRGDYCHMKAQNALEKNVVVKFSHSPLVWKHDGPYVIQEVTLTSNKEVKMKLDPSFKGDVHWMAVSKGDYPESGVLDKPQMNIKIRSRKLGYAYAAINPRNTVNIYDETAYAVLQQ